MSKEIYISSTPHETRLAIVENDALTEIYYERENEYTLAGSIYNGKVTRVLPGMQSSFVDIGLERDAFLYITDFMEEAGDSADFEVPRQRQAAIPVATAATVATATATATPRHRSRRFHPAMPLKTLPPAATVVTATRDRGGRGRRDRGRSGNRDRQPRPERTDSPQPTTSVNSGYEAPDAEFTYQPVFEENAIPADLPDSSELGEAAPGADGSRRWRGRRGRRRGRGPGSGEESQATDNQSETQTLNEAAPEADSNYEDSSREFDATAAEPTPEVLSAPRNTAPVASAYGQPEGQRSDRNDRGRDRDRGRGRGDRGGRNRGDRDRGPRNDSRGPRTDDRGPRSDDRAPRIPRGFAPKTDLYGVDSTPAYAAPAYGEAPEAPAGEPIILPGESLSKYRKGEEAPVSKPAAALAETIVLPAAAGYTLSSDWDGGSVLPGETLSRRRS